MCKNIGIVFTLFFFCIALSCLVFSHMQLNPYIVISLIHTVLFSITIGNSNFHKILQIVVTLCCGCFSVLSNDPNSLVSVLVLFIGTTMIHKYFPKRNKLIYTFPIFYLITALLSGWEVRHIVNATLLNVAFSTILLIFNTPQKQNK